MKELLLITAAVVFHAYIFYAFRKVKMQKSISKTYTKLKWVPAFSKIKILKERHLFQIMIFTVSLCIGYAGGNHVYYASGALLFISGFFPTINNPVHLPIHVFLSSTSILYIFIGNALFYSDFYPISIIASLVAIIIMVDTTMKNIITWIEIFSFEVIMVYLLWF